MKIVAIVQARMTSTRLPGKVLLELPSGSGVTVLEHVIRRLKRVKLLDEIVVAIPTDKEEDVLVPIIEKENVKVFRGDKNNVLERYYKAAVEHKADVIVRITSDCPCIDPKIVNDFIEYFLKGNAVYATADFEKKLPKGLDVEVFSFAVLENTYENAETDYDKEHVTSFIYTTDKFSFRQLLLQPPKDIIAPGIRLTLDTPEDCNLLCGVFNHLYEANPFFDIYDIIDLFNKHPELKLINQPIEKQID